MPFAAEIPRADSSLPSGGTPPRKGGRANLSNLSPEQRKKWRASQLRDAKQRERSRRTALGDKTITITVTAGELACLEAFAKRQRGPDEGFYRRALLLGAAFAANAGNPRGKKVKGNVAAAAINPAIVDASSLDGGKA